MHIFLIRHGESTLNSGDNYVKRIPDYSVELTEEGRKQAYEAGKWLAEYCQKNGISLKRARIWRSPYKRTRQTSEEFNKSLKISDIREDITLIEQSFGYWDSIPEEEWKNLYPREYDEYVRLKENKGKFYAKPPGGESPFDVSIRIHQFFDTIYRDYNEKGVDTLFVFTHGTTLRAFLLRWFHYTPEWFQSEHNPKNCWIREILGDNDLGYINN